MSIERPKRVQDAIVEGNTDLLRALGKKGAQKRAEKFEKKRIIEEYDQSEEFQRLYKSQLDSLRQTYPQLDEEGIPVDEDWYEQEAKRIALAIMKMKERQSTIEKRR